MTSESDKWGWKHVSVFGGFQTRTGTKRWKCNHCNLRYNGSYSRVRAHLLGFSGVGVRSCPAIDRSLREAFQILEEERLARKKKRVPGSGKSSKHVQSAQPAHSSVVKSIGKEDVDDVVARFVYADELDFNIVSSPYFQDMAKAIASFGPGYEPPSEEKLLGSILIKEKARLVKSVGPIRESWPHTGCTIFCLSQLGGAIDSFHFSIYVSSPRGIIFLQTLSSKEGDGTDDSLTGVLRKMIIEIGPKNVIQVIVHLGLPSGLSESFIPSEFPHIFCSPCISHCIEMFMEEITELDWMKPIVSCGRGIEQCILAKERSSLFLFSQSLKEDNFDPLTARFAPTYNMIRRIVELKQVLQEVVVSTEWKQWKHSFPEDVLSIEAAILGDDFWDGAHLMLQLFEPFVRLLGSLNIERSVMGDVYYWRVQALEAMRSKGIDDMVLKRLELLMDNKWEMLFSPLHAAGYILNPRYFGKDQAKDKIVMRGWKSTLERCECDGTPRRVLREQLSSYWRLEGSLGDEDAMDCRDKMNPVSWWENFGSETPQLQTLAIKILSQISSVSTFQGRWNDDDDESSCQAAVKKLGVEKRKDLVFVRNNLRLHGRRHGKL